MALALSALTTARDDSGSQTGATASVTITAGRFYILFLTVRGNPLPIADATLSGLSRTWGAPDISYYFPGSFHHSMAWAFLCSSTQTGTISWDATANTQTVGWQLVEITGQPSSGVVVQRGQTSGASPTTLTLSAFSSAQNAGVGWFWGRGANDTFTVGSGFTSLGSIGASNNQNAMGEYSINDPTIDASWSTFVEVGVIGYEISGQAQIFVGGSITPIGTLGKMMTKLFAGSITPVGTLAKAVAKTLALAGSITPVGTLTKTMSKFFSGSITPVGTLSRSVFHPFLHFVTEVARVLVGKSEDSKALTAKSETGLTLTAKSELSKTLTQKTEDSKTLTRKDEVQG